MKDLLHKLNLDANAVYAGAKAVAVVAAGFALILCFLLITNYLQTRQVDPLNSKTMDALVQRLDENPGDADLRDQVRTVHLLSRKAYFTNRWQLRTGGALLLVSVVLLLAALKTMENLRRELPNPADFPADNNAWSTLSKARGWVGALGALVIGGALLTALMAERELGPSAAAGPAEEATPPTAASATADAALNWPAFRGAGGLGHTLLKQPPLEWDVGAGRNVLWKVAVPLPGFSSPVVWGKRLFLTGGDATVRKVFCFDAESGAILWEKEVATTLDNPLIAGADGHAGYAAATPATDGNYVCAIFATGDLACFDVEGNAVWARNLGRPDNHYGHSSSLILEDGRVFVQFDQNSNSKLYAFEVATGEVAWETGRSVISWASPILAHTGSRSELILANCETVDAYNPQTGEQLWSVACMAGEMGPSPAWADGLVFAANDYARAVGIRATGNNAQVIWEFDEDLPDAASPLATARYLYLPTSYGFLVCLDAKTGEKIWDAEFDYGFEASPISTGEYIYALDKGGTMHIFRPGDTYTSVADIPLGEKSGSTPALVEGRIYIRGEEHLFCIGTGD